MSESKQREPSQNQLLIAYIEEQIEEMEMRLNEAPSLSAAPEAVGRTWKASLDCWQACCREKEGIPPALFKKFRALLLRTAEAISAFPEAAAVSKEFEQDLVSGLTKTDADSDVTLDMIIQCAEVHRRCCKVDEALARLGRAESHLAEFQAQASRDEQQDHCSSLCKVRGRLLYEQASIQRFSGRTSDAVVTLEHSAEQCEKGGDLAGASAATIIRGIAMIEDGVPDLPREILTAEESLLIRNYSPPRGPPGCRTDCLTS